MDFLCLSMFIINTTIMKRSIIIRNFTRNITPISMFQASNNKSNIDFTFTCRSNTIKIRRILRSTNSNIIAQSRRRLIRERCKDLHFSAFLTRYIMFYFFTTMAYRAFICLPACFVIGKFNGRTCRKRRSFTKYE